MARRGGNYNNTSNAGLGYLNVNNPRSNVNANYGARGRSSPELNLHRRLTWAALEHKGDKGRNSACGENRRREWDPPFAQIADGGML